MNRKTLITGASRGLGRALAGFLARQGDTLILTARGEPDLEDTADELSSTGAEIKAVAGDIADPAHRRRLVEAARPFGGLDLLVNNASVLGPSPLKKLLDLDPEALTHIFDVNTFAPLALIREAAPLLEERRGLVVNLSSDAAEGGYAGWGGYGASKAALDLVSRTLANELEPQGIAVVSVDPGDMNTAMHQAAYPGEDISDRPDPGATLPFWAWLLGQEPPEITGRRFQAQSERWMVTG